MLTELDDETKDLKAVMEAGSHLQLSMSVKHYIKGRQDMHQAAEAVERRYTLKSKKVGK